MRTYRDTGRKAVLARQKKPRRSESVMLPVAQSIDGMMTSDRRIGESGTAPGWRGRQQPPGMQCLLERVLPKARLAAPSTDRRGDGCDWNAKRKDSTALLPDWAKVRGRELGHPLAADMAVI